MGKNTRLRTCPALQRDISPADCGAQRHSSISCTDTCVFNPFSAANYMTLLEIEDRADGALMRHIVESREDEEGLARLRHYAETHSKSKSEVEAQTVFTWHAFFKKDGSGRSLAKRWEDAGFPGVKNDERRLLTAKTLMRISLIEVRQVLDEQCLLCMDLFRPEEGLHVFLDRSLAGEVPRFSTFLGWTYRLPHFNRLSGIGLIMPTWAPFSPMEIVRVASAHLGAPAGGEALFTWLAENMERLNKTLHATGLARQAAMFEKMDAVSIRSEYTLVHSYEDCVAALQEAKDLAKGPVWADEPDEEVSIAFDVSNPDSKALPGERELLGQIKLSKHRLYLEGNSNARHQSLKQRCERILGSKIRFSSEKREDLSEHLRSAMPSFDSSLVVTTLLNGASGFETHFGSMAAPPTESNLADFTARHQQSFLENWVNTPNPALQNKSPKEAASDPALRPLVTELVKAQIRLNDEANLRSGRSDDINWMPRSLGTPELDVPPPPARAVPPDNGNDDDILDFPQSPASRHPRSKGARLAPPLGMSTDEALDRLQESFSFFETAEEALDSLDRSKVPLVDTAAYVLDNQAKDPRVLSVAIPCLIGLWHVYFSPGDSGVPLPDEVLAEAFDAEMTRLTGEKPSSDDKGIAFLFHGCPQPGLLEALFGRIGQSNDELPKRDRCKPEEILLVLVLLKTFITHIDREARKL
ncbi:MAG: hypothetical protein WC378_11725 [Opitutaceae bacterium]